METLKSWIMGIVTFLLVMTLVEQMIPRDKYRKYVRLAMGLILILMISTPILSLLGVDEKVFRNFVQENLKLSSMEAEASRELFDEDSLFSDAYEETVRRQIVAYFESQSLTVVSCTLTMETDASGEGYGQIQAVSAELLLPDGARDADGETSGIRPVEPVRVTPETEESQAADRVPQGEIDQWKSDISSQYGVDPARVTLTVR